MEVDGYHMVIGVGMTLIPVDHICKPGEEGSLLGYFWPHNDAAGERCPAHFMYVCKQHDAKEKWEDVSKGRGLSLKPSLLCERCDLHGFVTDGRWVGVGPAPTTDWPQWAKDNHRPHLEVIKGGKEPVRFFNGKRVSGRQSGGDGRFSRFFHGFNPGGYFDGA